MTVHRYGSAEWSFVSAKTYADPFHDVKLTMHVACPDGNSVSVPGFWAGENVWKVRFSSPLTGEFTYVTESSEPSLSRQSGSFTVTPYEGSNPLYLHGPVCRKGDDLHLSHDDGTPFFWLGDTWWMGFTTRLSFPEEFAELTADRVKKGFNVVQLVAGLYPDMEPFDPRGANEAGFPWTEDFSSVCPAYFDAAEKRIFHLIENGISPFLVGSWGFFMKFVGMKVLKEHWQYMIARWASCPVIWCVAGEANMTFYDDDSLSMEEHLKQSRKNWNEMTSFFRECDPFHRLVTIHPTVIGHEQIEDETLLDADLLQTGHSGVTSLVPTLKWVKETVDRKKHPVINDECCYEGNCGTSYCDIQRYVYLSNIFLGSAGFTYGANGLWQVNGVTVPYGASPHGASWGDTSWKDAAALPGSGQIGMCKTWLEQYPWHRMERHPEWVENPNNAETLDGNFCIGIPGEVRLFFVPLYGGSFWGSIRIYGLEQDVSYEALRFDPLTGTETLLGDVTPDEQGAWQFPRVPMFHDWIMAIRRKSAL